MTDGDSETNTAVVQKVSGQRNSKVRGTVWQPDSLEEVVQNRLLPVSSNEPHLTENVEEHLTPTACGLAAKATVIGIKGCWKWKYSIGYNHVGCPCSKIYT